MRIKKIFSRIQAKKGKKGGSLSCGGGRKIKLDSERQVKPWIGFGISRATYYRKKAKNEI